MKQSAIKLGAILGIGALMITTSCKKEIETGFTADKTTAAIGEAIKFADNAAEDRVNTSFEWDFGDGTKSYDRNPSHTYHKAGTYSVTQTVIVNKNAEKGKNRQSTSKIDITVEGPTANFSTTKSDYAINEAIQFENSTTGGEKGSNISYNWSFTSSNGHTGDFSSMKSPSRAFTDAGTYTITLRVTQGQTTSFKTTDITVGGSTSPTANAARRAMIVGEWKGSDNAEVTEYTGFSTANTCRYWWINPTTQNWEQKSYENGTKGTARNPISAVRFTFNNGVEATNIIRKEGNQTTGANAANWNLSADGNYLTFTTTWMSAEQQNWEQHFTNNSADVRFLIKTITSNLLVLEEETILNTWQVDCGNLVTRKRTVTLTRN
jgi:PKD repeat protein